MIARIYGIFTFMTNQFQALDIVIMQNTAHLYDNRAKKFSFDLKGSKIDRNVKFNPKTSSKNSPLLKDMNFEEIERANRKGQENFLVSLNE